MPGESGPTYNYELEPTLFSREQLADIFLSKLRETQELINPEVVRGFLDKILANKLPSREEAENTVEQAKLLGRFAAEKAFYELFSDQPLPGNV